MQSRIAILPVIAMAEGEHSGRGDCRYEFPFRRVGKDGKRVSTLDLVGDGFTLLSAAEGAGWSAAAREAANAAGGLPLKAYRFGQELRDPENGFAATDR